MMQMLNDMGWLMFVAVISSVIVQIVSIGIAILIDHRPEPIFPRWVGYLNLWVAAGLTPLGIVVFFKDGPFAWNGLFGFYIPLACYVVWMGVMFFVLLKAVDKDSLDGDVHA
jgi:hypothetical protein